MKALKTGLERGEHIPLSRDRASWLDHSTIYNISKLHGHAYQVNK